MTAEPYPSRLAVAKPLYSQVRDVLLKRIGEGEWGAGEALPNEFRLASDFGVSIGTIRRAIEGLEETGVLKRLQGRGTFVAGPGSMALDDKFCRLRLSGRPATGLGYELDSVSGREADTSEAHALGHAQPVAVTEIRQRLTIDGQPVGHEVSLVTVLRFPRIETQLPYGQMLYRVLADYGALVTRSVEKITAVTADDDLAGKLGVGAGQPLLEVRRIALTIDKEPVELRCSHYNLNRFPGLTYDTFIT